MLCQQSLCYTYISMYCLLLREHQGLSHLHMRSTPPRWIKEPLCPRHRYTEVLCLGSSSMSTCKVLCNRSQAYAGALRFHEALQVSNLHKSRRHFQVASPDYTDVGGAFWCTANH